jgi:putative CocE/NonD family hydrolase
MKRLAAGGIAAIVIFGSATAHPAPQAASPTTSAPSPAPKPDGSADRSYYLPMRDGVRIAVSLWYPGHRAPTQKSPVLLVQTRYGRTGVYIHNENGHYDDFRRAGYVVAVLDTRGSTASFGPREVEMGPDEVRDMDEIIRHFQTQPWSNGQVIAQGVSYMADTADLATGSTAHLTGAIVRESDFDIYRDLMNPGGVSTNFFLDRWGTDTLRRDLGQSVDPALNLDCRLRIEDCSKLFPRLVPVDADRDFTLIRQAINGRHRWTPETYKDAEFFDDVAKNGYRMSDSSPAARLAEVREEAVPVQYWGSWMDAGTADAALSRYVAAPNVPAQVIISANDHGGEQSTDPFFAGQNPPRPPFDDQVAAMMAFTTKVRAGNPIGRSIHYYVLGAKAFRDTPVWPPEGVAMRRLNLAAGNALVGEHAPTGGGADRYAVDFTATTGQATRWSTQIGTPAAYPDRRAADAKLIAYTSAPFDHDVELVGRPDVTLLMAAETHDPAIFVYLEDVAPDGRVTYLTEGELRAIDRKPADPAKLPYPIDAPAHTYDRGDVLPVTPGKPFEARIALFPVAVLIRQGHAIRIAIAGADADCFRRYSEGRSDVFTIYHGLSAVDIPLRPWN